MAAYMHPKLAKTAYSANPGSVMPSKVIKTPLWGMRTMAMYGESVPKRMALLRWLAALTATMLPVKRRRMHPSKNL